MTKNPSNDVVAAAEAKQSVIDHPEAWEATLLRMFVVPSRKGKFVDKESHYHEEDSDYEYHEQGEGRLLHIGEYDGTVRGYIDEYDTGRAFMECRFVCLVEPGHEDYFIPQKGDLIFQEVFVTGVRLAYEIVDIKGSDSTPFGNKRYILFPREDLDFYPPKSRKRKAAKKNAQQRNPKR